MSASSVARTSNEEGGQSSAATARILEYPRVFFTPGTGQPPKTTVEARAYWKYRKNRPPEGAPDPEEPDGRVMLKEMKGIRDSLRTYTKEQFWEYARQAAVDEGIILESTGVAPVTQKDFDAILQDQMTFTEQNVQKVAKIFCVWHSDRNWMAQLVDRWMKDNNMKLMDPVVDPNAGTGSKKVYADARGSFGDVVKVAKAEVINSHMDKLWRKQHWKVIKAKKKSKDPNCQIVRLKVDDGKTWEGKPIKWTGWLVSPVDWSQVDQGTSAGSVRENTVS